MPLSYHPNWDKSRDRLDAFWNREAIGRGCLQIHAPSKTPIPGPARPATPDDQVARWTDPDFLIPNHDFHMRNTFYGGESVPSHWINLGPGIMATYLGSEPVFHPSTVWFGPIDYKYDKPLVMDETNKWWKLTKDLTRISSEFFDGKAVTGITDIGGGADVLASLRVTENLLIDMVENPEPIKRAVDEIADCWIKCYSDLYDITSAHASGSIQWLGLWAPGRMYNIQSDYCCMVSPTMFEEFIAPELEKLCRFLDYALYHLDGPGAVKHLDRLLSIPELNGIQWTSGDGAPPVIDWIPMYKKIQAAGKCLHLNGSPRHVERIFRALKPEGLIYSTWCGSEEEARDILRLAECWSAGPRED